MWWRKKPDQQKILLHLVRETFKREALIMATLDDIQAKVTAQGVVIDTIKPQPPTDTLSPANQAKVDSIEAGLVVNDGKLAALVPPPPPPPPPTP